MVDGRNPFFVPEDKHDAEYAGHALSQRSAMVTRLLDAPQRLVLHHTAEQLGMLDEDNQVLYDPWIRWRHETRNVVGDNDWEGLVDLLHDPKIAASTARDCPGHRCYGAGLDVSASAAGRFPYRQNGQLRWYDLSLEDLPCNSDGGGGGGDWM